MSHNHSFRYLGIFLKDDKLVQLFQCSRCAKKKIKDLEKEVMKDVI